MADTAKQHYETHMAEYKVLRSEVTLYSQRIDRTVGIYLSALFGLSGYLLRPESQFSVGEYLRDIQTSPTLSGVFLVIGILNCLLIIRIQSFYLAVLAMSQYTATVIKPRISALLQNEDLMNWDDPEIVRGKRYWLPARSAAQAGFGVIAISISVLAVFVTYRQATSDAWLLVLFLIIVALLFYCLYTLVRIWIVGRNFHEPASVRRMEDNEENEP